MNYLEHLNNIFPLQEEYLGNNKKINSLSPMVSVHVITYQHVDYIKKCLDGILMQKTDFPYEIVIGEDCSTDGTREICKKYAEQYPDKIRLFLRNRDLTIQKKENKTFYFNGKLTLKSCRGKYIALCEGDDYWTDPHKLQKQVQVLETDTTISVCSSGYIDNFGNLHVSKDLKEETTQIAHSKGFIFNFEQHSKYWLIKSLTVVFRNEIDFNLLTQFSFSRDIHLNFYLLQKGRGFYIKEALGQYNIHEGGMVSQKSKRELIKISYTVYKEFYQKEKHATLRRKYLGYSILMLKAESQKGYYLREVIKNTCTLKDFIYAGKLLVTG